MFNYVIFLFLNNYIFVWKWYCLVFKLRIFYWCSGKENWASGKLFNLYHKLWETINQTFLSLGKNLFIIFQPEFNTVRVWFQYFTTMNRKIFCFCCTFQHLAPQGIEVWLLTHPDDFHQALHQIHLIYWDKMARKLNFNVCVVFIQKAKQIAGISVVIHRCKTGLLLARYMSVSLVQSVKITCNNPYKRSSYKITQSLICEN